MSSKNMLRMKRLIIFPRAFFFHFIKLIFLLFTVYCFSETVDRIVAVVNEQVITLTDLRISEAFGLHDEELKERSGNLRPLILERLIDQKLVIALAGEDIFVENEELDSYQARIIEKLGNEEVRGKLEEFGLNWEDLRAYILEKIIYQKIISRKFDQRIIVSLKEIEDYYKQSYVSSQREKGLESRPMMEILDEIESLIIQEKVKTQINDWIKNLRKKADIQKLLQLM
jgi:peptidyl-prolyl cis-trans isomerase SurA